MLFQIDLFYTETKYFKDLDLLRIFKRKASESRVQVNLVSLTLMSTTFMKAYIPNFIIQSHTEVVQ